MPPRGGPARHMKEQLQAVELSRCPSGLPQAPERLRKREYLRFRNVSGLVS